MLKTISKTVTRVLLSMGASVLAMMMFLTAVDVVMRYLFNRPISGAFELTEYMMAIFVPFSIVYCAEQKEHVAVELILSRFPQSVQHFFNLGTSLVTMIFALFIAWQNALYIVETYESKMTSAVLLIPTYPFVVPTALGIGAFVLVLCVQWLELLGGVKNDAH